MAKVYVSINGDSVGQKISDSILSNDPEAVRQTSADFNAAHAEIDQWVESVGGRVISASGDEAIYELEDSQIGQIESLMDKYQAKTGHTLTAGVGADMLSSVKAMTYGKMHDPGQIIEYDQEVENGLAPQEEAEAEEIAGQGEGEQPMNEQGLDPAQDFAEDAEEQEDDEQDSDNIEADEEADTFGGNTEPIDGDLGEDMQEDMEDQSLDQEGQEQFGQEDDGMEDSDNDGIDDSQEDGFAGDEQGQDFGGEEEEDDDLNPPHEQGLSPEEGMVHDAEEQEDDEQDSDNIEADEEPSEFGGNTEPMDGDFDEDAQEDMENQDQDQAAEGQSPILDMIHANAGDEDQEEDQDFGGDDEMEDPSMQGQEMEDPSMQGQDDGMEGDDLQELSPEDLAGQDDGMEDPNMEGQDPNMQGDEGQDLKTRVAQTLQNFTMNKEKIDAMQQTDPDMYQSVISMIDRMIEMAKELNASPADEGQDDGMEDPNMGLRDGSEEEGEEFSEEDPEAEDQDFGGEEEEELEEDPEEDEESEEEAPAPKGKGFPPKKVEGQEIKKSIRLPKRTKHVAKPQNPLGWIKNGRIKVQDGDTGKVGWRGVRRGLLADLDGEPTSARRNLEGAKIPRSHSVHSGKKVHTTILQTSSYERF